MPYPGDGVDNDCNDETDEIPCTEASISKYMKPLVDRSSGINADTGITIISFRLQN